MKSIIYKRYGSPDVLHAATLPKPVPEANQVLIKIHYATTSVADCRVRSLDVPLAVMIPVRIMLGITAPKNQTLGAELAGTVEAVGANVGRFRVGDSVIACTLPTFGAYAEYICLDETLAIAHKPDNLSFEQAAALPIGARTALYYFRKAHAKAGQRVMVYGASGSVGTYAVQYAKHLGAEVTAVCSGRNVDLVKSLGADHVIDYTKESLDSLGGTYDIVFEAVGKSEFSDCKQILVDGGAYINVVRPFPTLEMIWGRRAGNLTLLMGDSVPESSDDMAQVAQLAESGAIAPVIDRSFPLEQVADAHRYVETGRKKGKVVIKVI